MSRITPNFTKRLKSEEKNSVQEQKTEIKSEKKIVITKPNTNEPKKGD